MVVRFFVVAFAITWILQGLAALAPEPLVLPLIAIAACGPSLAAILLTRRAGAPLATLWRGGGGVGWHLVALAWPSAMRLVAGALTGGVAVMPPDVGATVLPPIGEELGWRGYALPRLAARRGVLIASLIVGVAWALWHVPISILGGTTAIELGRFLVGVVAVSIIMGWLWDRTRGSVTVAIVGHAGLNLGLVAGSPWTAVLVLLAASAAAFDLGRRPRG